MAECVALWPLHENRLGCVLLIRRGAGWTLFECAHRFPPSPLTSLKALQVSQRRRFSFLRPPLCGEAASDWRLPPPGTVHTSFSLGVVTPICNITITRGVAFRISLDLIWLRRKRQLQRGSSRSIAGRLRRLESNVGYMTSCLVGMRITLTFVRRHLFSHSQTVRKTPKTGWMPVYFRALRCASPRFDSHPTTS